MPVMSRANMAQGFSVSQPTFNSPLQFCPALGTQELDDLINAYVPGPASLQEKRTLVSMDFFNYSHATGESFRYYSVPSMTSSAGSSPAQDSGSSFVSPALSTWSWPQSVSTSASTPSSSTQEYASRAAPSKKASPVSRASPPDFSHLPGMKIMTKDGRDVTNSASRGCKTKEQRDHAHLMRIIKACDACKKKKIRCDPSHKKRTSGATPAASQTPAQSTARTKTTTAKKAKMASPPPPQVPSPPHFFSADAASFHLDPAFASFDADLLELDAMTQESWESFVQYDEPVAAIPGDYDFFFDPAGHFSPTSSMSASPASRIQAVSALGQEVSFADVQESAVSSTNVPALPYMVAGAAGTDYVDFNLFSPTSSFVDDESMPVNDIGMVSAADSYGVVRDPTLYEESLQQSTEYAVPGPRVRGGVQNVEYQQFVQMRDRQESVAHGGSSSCSVSGGAQKTGDMAVADVHGQVYYAPPVRHEPEPDLSPTSALDVRREVTQDQLVNAASRSTPLLRGSRAERASRRSPLANATSESIGGDATVVNQCTVPVSVTSPTAAAATSRVTSPASVAVYAPRGVNAAGLQGLAKSPVLSSPTMVIPYGPGTAVGVSGVKDVEKCRGTQPSSQPVHSISALVALGVLASGMPASLAVCLIQFVLGLMVLGSILSPKTTKLASSEQRICGTTPLPSTDQDEKQGLLASARHHCPGGEGRSPAHYHSCRQMDHARPIEAVGRLAALRLSCALTQWNI